MESSWTRDLTHLPCTGRWILIQCIHQGSPVSFLLFSFFATPCSMWDLVPRAGIEPVPPAVEVWRLNHWTAREVPWEWKLLCCVRLFATPWTMGSTVYGILQARILEWVAVPFSRGSSQPTDRTQVSCIVGGFFTSWATREVQKLPLFLIKDFVVVTLYHYKYCQNALGPKER